MFLLNGLKSCLSFLLSSGLAGTVLVYKIAGALAHRGASLDHVHQLAIWVSQNIATIGASLGHVHVRDVPALLDAHERVFCVRFQEPSLFEPIYQRQSWKLVLASTTSEAAIASHLSLHCLGSSLSSWIILHCKAILSAPSCR